jgi:hypothetical protein
MRRHAVHVVQRKWRATQSRRQLGGFVAVGIVAVGISELVQIQALGLGQVGPDEVGPDEVGSGQVGPRSGRPRRDRLDSPNRCWLSMLIMSVRGW